MKDKLIVLAVYVLLVGCSFLITAGIVKLGSEVFSFKYTWSLALFVWLVIMGI